MVARVGVEGAGVSVGAIVVRVGVGVARPSSLSSSSRSTLLTDVLGAKGLWEARKPSGFLLWSGEVVVVVVAAAASPSAADCRVPNMMLPRLEKAKELMKPSSTRLPQGMETSRGRKGRWQSEEDVLLMDVVEVEWDLFQKREELVDLGEDEGTRCLGPAVSTTVVAVVAVALTVAGVDVPV